MRTRRGIEPCQACNSQGVVDVDSYTGRVVAKVRHDPFAVSREEISETLQAESADADSRRRREQRVNFLLHTELEGEDFVDWVMRRREQLYRAGDYAKLDAALRLLDALEPRRVQAFLIVYGPRAAEYGAPRRAGGWIRVRAETALDWLERELPPLIRIPVWLEQPHSRDEEILRLARQRMPQAAIAARLGVSAATVGRRLRVLTSVA